MAVYDQRLREMNFGAFEGCTYEELKDNSLYRSWIDNPSTVTPPDGETWAQFDERLRSFLSDLGRAAEDTFVQAAISEKKAEAITNR
ncbi:MAG TPA: histidine phosphatase family protein, partial [Paenibacillus sp.]|nr:histidine phosphatase family protein [Paenibacillus sp.]